jgi:uncharacterized protein YukE
MADDKTRIDLELARHENRRLRQIGTRFGEAVGNLRGDTERYEGCWGGDKFGKAFGEGYKPNADQTLTSADTVNKGVGDVADAVDKTVTDFDTTDKNNSKNL